MITVRIVGDKALRARLHAAGRHYADLGEPTRRATSAIRATAARLAPKRTGRLAQATAARSSGGLGVVSNSIRYARYVEYGTRYMRAQPFMRTALQATNVVEPYEDHAEQSARIVG